MLMQENLKARGQVQVEILDEAGALKEKIHIPNLVVQVGRNYIAERMANTDDAVMSHMSTGTDNTTPASGDTTLGAENGRVALDSTVVNANVVTYTATFAPGTSTGALVEAGIFNDSGTDAGTMLCRTTFDVVNKAVADTMIITWAITIS
jgi:hypothetical protein